MCPRKETNFFAQQSALCLLENTITDVKKYEEQFADAGNAKAIGETSPAYLAVVPDTPKVISKLIPDIKLIAILRDPIERAYSHFLMRRRQGKEFRESFEQCIDEEDIDPARSYKSRGFYGKQVESYLKNFPPEQLRIFPYEQFTEDPKSVIQEICTFLGVDPNFSPDMSDKYNANPPAEPLSQEMKKKLIELYREDILKLQDLTDMDFSQWLQM